MSVCSPGSAAGTWVSGRPSSRRTMFVPWATAAVLKKAISRLHALAAEAAVGRDDEPLGGDVLQRLADRAGDVLGLLDLQACGG